MTFSVGIPFAGEVGGVEYVSTSSDISGRQIYCGRSSVIIGQRSWEALPVSIEVSQTTQMSSQPP